MGWNGNMYFGPKMPSLDLIVPVFNPLPGWEDTVIQRFQSIQVSHPSVSFYLIIVNDGSDRLDDSEAVKKLTTAFPNFKWISYKPNHGKGYALRQGVALSAGDLIVYTDIDWPYTEESMSNVIVGLQEGADIAVGVREEAYYAQMPKLRRFISKGLRKFNARLIHLKVDDTQAGLKGFTKNVKPVFLSATINRYLFDLEFIYLASKEKLNIVSIPIELREGITFSKMNRNILFQEARNFIRIWLKG